MAFKQNFQVIAKKNDVQEINNFQQDYNNWEEQEIQHKFATFEFVQKLKNLIAVRMKEREKIFLPEVINQIHFFSDFRCPSNLQLIKMTKQLTKYAQHTMTFLPSNWKKLESDNESILEESQHQIPQITFTNRQRIAPSGSANLLAQYRGMQDITAEGLLITQNIIRIEKPVILLTSQLQIRFTAILRGCSRLNFILHGTQQQIQREETGLIQLIKEGFSDQSKLHLMIGVYNPDDHEFSFLKKTEVPIYRESNINFLDDALYLNGVIIDYGDDKAKISLIASFTENPNKKKETIEFQQIYQNILVPTLDESILHVAANGNDVTLQLLEVSQIKEQKEQSCQMCKIF